MQQNKFLLIFHSREESGFESQTHIVPRLGHITSDGIIAFLKIEDKAKFGLSPFYMCTYSFPLP